MIQKFTKVKSQSVSRSENKLKLNETALDSAKPQGTINSIYKGTITDSAKPHGTRNSIVIVV
jgi:hypothetical protein